MAPSMLDRYFLSHPRAAGQSYAQHRRFAWRFSRALFGAAFAALVHGMFPSIFPTSASETIRRLHAELDRRHGQGDL